MFRTVLMAILVPLLTLLAGALLAVVLRPRPRDDVMRQAIGDAPYLPVTRIPARPPVVIPPAPARQEQDGLKGAGAPGPVRR